MTWTFSTEPIYRTDRGQREKRRTLENRTCIRLNRRKRNDFLGAVLHRNCPISKVRIVFASFVTIDRSRQTCSLVLSGESSERACRVQRGCSQRNFHVSNGSRINIARRRHHLRSFIFERVTIFWEKIRLNSINTDCFKIDNQHRNFCSWTVLQLFPLKQPVQMGYRETRMNRYWLARFYQKLFTVQGMVNGCDAPCNADPQEDVHRVTSGHVAHARIGVLVLAGGHLARERVCNKVIRLDFSSMCIAFFYFLFISPSFSLLTSSSI